MPGKSKFSPEKLATFNRQKCIQLLEKITKNMFKMFRDETVTKDHIVDRFNELYKQLESFDKVDLHAEYHAHMREYIHQVKNTFDSGFNLDDIRAKNLSALNRLQKLKNKKNYKRSTKVQKYESTNEQEF